MFVKVELKSSDKESREHNNEGSNHGEAEQD